MGESNSYGAAVLGAGRQGVCAAFDLATWGGASRLILVERDRAVLEKALSRLRRLVPGIDCDGRIADGADEEALTRALAGCRVALSALPYRFNPRAARAAIRAGCSFLDLGGNTAISAEVLAQHHAAVEAGVSLIPDTGLAPGLGNTLAARGVELLDQAREARIWCGGLPQRPLPPLGYRLVFSMEGLLNEYSGEAEYLRRGQLVRVPALSEVTALDWPAWGSLEAFPTSGGTSTAPESFLGILETYEYRTLRYPGHCRRIAELAELGLLSEVPLAAGKGTTIRPRDLLVRLLTPLLDRPEIPDLILLRVAVRGTWQGREAEVVFDLEDLEDPATGFTAMERCTAFPAAVVAEMAALGELARGALKLETGVPAGPYLERLARRPLALRQTGPVFV